MLNTLAKLITVVLILASCSSSSPASETAAATPSAAAIEQPTTAPVNLPVPTPTAPTATATLGNDDPVRSADVAAYEGLGAWLDVWDYSPNYASTGVPPAGPDVVDEMAAAGVQTLYLQTVRRDDRTVGLIEDPDLLAEFISRAHGHDMAVVGWYLPTWSGPEHEDLDRLLAVLDFDVDGQWFDGVAVDIEGVPEPAERAEWSRRVVSLSTSLRAAAGDRAIGAIVLPPVVLEEVNDEYWPDFPWTEIGPLYDAWMPMTYWSFRKSDSPWADAAVYTTANIERLRINIDDPDAFVHAIGGIGLDNDLSETSEPIARVDDLAAFVDAADATNSIGWSIYDWMTISSNGRQLMAELGQQRNESGVPGEVDPISDVDNCAPPSRVLAGMCLPPVPQERDCQDVTPELSDESDGEAGPPSSGFETPEIADEFLGAVEQLIVTDLVVGYGCTPEVGDILTMRSMAVDALDGREFSNTWTMGGPFHTVYGRRGSIDAWTEGLEGMKVGGERILQIPSDQTDRDGAVVYRVQLVRLTEAPPAHLLTFDGPVPDHLAITTLIEGTGDGAEIGDLIDFNIMVVLHEDGTILESSWQEGFPRQTVLKEGADPRSSAWQEGMIGIKVGERRQFTILKSVTDPDSDSNDAHIYIVEPLRITKG